MPITDNDLVAVVRATRSGTTNIAVEVDWTDGFTNEPKGRYSMSWATADEFKAWLEGQSFEDVMRAVLLQCLNRNTGALRATVFDGLIGHTFQVQQRSQQVA